MRPNFSEETVGLIFSEKSSEYPGGRIALLADGRVIFPEVRFHPQVGKKYPCQVRFYEKRDRDTVIGIAYHETSVKLSDEEYLKEEQLVVAVTFVRERGSSLVARHPVSGAYIVPTEAAVNLIKAGAQCWVMVVQRGTSLVAHYIKDVEGAETAPPPTRALALRDPTFAARAEEALQEKGMGAPPVFRFQGKQQFPWEILGVGRDASLEDIRQAYRVLAKELHPDVKPGGEENFVSLAHAGDWMTFRRLWVDEVTKKTRKAGPAPAEAPAPAPLPEPAGPPKADESLSGPEVSLKQILGETIFNGEYKRLVNGAGVKTPEDFLVAALGKRGGANLAQFKELTGLENVSKGRLEAAVKRVKAWQEKNKPR